jgi:hypothetical protein
MTPISPIGLAHHPDEGPISLRPLGPPNRRHLFFLRSDEPLKMNIEHPSYPLLIAEDEPRGNEATIKSLACGGSIFEGDLCGDDV